METIKEALMQWGEAIHLGMENRTMSYSPVLNHWRVKKWAGKDARSFIYDGESFTAAFECLLGPHAAGTMLASISPGAPPDIQESPASSQLPAAGAPDPKEDDSNDT